MEHLPRGGVAEEGHGAVRGAAGARDPLAQTISPRQAVAGDVRLRVQHGRCVHLRPREPGQGSRGAGERLGICARDLRRVDGGVREDLSRERRRGCYGPLRHRHVLTVYHLYNDDSSNPMSNDYPTLTMNR